MLASQLCPTLCDPTDCSPPGSCLHGILQQEYCSGLPFPSPGDLPDPGIEPTSLMSPEWVGRFFTTETQPPNYFHIYFIIVCISTLSCLLENSWIYN